MSKHRNLRQLWAVFIVAAVLCFGFLGSLFLIEPEPQLPAVQGYSTGSGQVTICVNSAPVLDLSSCQHYAFEDAAYNCTVGVSDLQQSSFSYAVSRVSGSSSLDALLVMSGTGLSFTPNSTHIGNYTLRFTADDLSGCTQNIGTAELNLTINATSDAPYLVTPIPDSEMDANTVMLPYDLDDYFADPNGDALLYAVFDNTNIRIDIDPLTGEVMLIPALNWCGTEQVYYRASDPGGLTANSNTVTITVNCISTSTGGSSGGGGGGGGSNRRIRCDPSYSCFEWSSCQLTRVVSAVTGNSSLIEIDGVAGNRVYRIPTEYTTDPSAYYSGFQYRECFDSLRCTEDVDVRVRPCTYEPGCSDGLLNQDETAIDCGGTICGACGACTDGIQNGRELDIDCGGPECPACHSCVNGKMDGKELGVDCGGPECAACATCFDGVQNQDETGVDCGGLFCDECSEQQYPSAAGMPWLTGLLLLLVVLVLLVVFGAVLKRALAAWFMRLSLKHKHRDRVILLPANIKDEILRRLNELEQLVDTDPVLKSQEELARIIRDYFKESLQLDFEFTYEELIAALEENRLNPLLQKILRAYFTRISELEFSGVQVSPLVLHTLIQEMRELVYQTAVLTVDDLKQRESDLELREIPAGTPPLDRAYLLLSQVHLALQFRKVEIAAAVYTVLRDWYAVAPPAAQRAIFDDLSRVHDEYTLVNK